jgi:hypothetical protein
VFLYDILYKHLNINNQKENEQTIKKTSTVRKMFKNSKISQACADAHESVCASINVFNNTAEISQVYTSKRRFALIK